jgi:hypothetical protein
VLHRPDVLVVGRINEAVPPVGRSWAICAEPELVGVMGFQTVGATVNSILLRQSAYLDLPGNRAVNLIINLCYPPVPSELRTSG